MSRNIKEWYFPFVTENWKIKEQYIQFAIANWYKNVVWLNMYEEYIYNLIK